MTSNVGVKGAEAAGAPPPPSNFDLYAGDFSCDDDISFENLLQLDNDIDRAVEKPSPAASTLHQDTISPTAQMCRQPSVDSAQPPSAIGSEASAPMPMADTVVYLLTTSALRPASSAVAATYDTVARNDVRPLLRFQLSKRPNTTNPTAYGIELGGPVVATGLAPQRGPDMASITSPGDRGCAPTPSTDVQQLQRRLALTTAFNGDLTQRSITAAVVASGTAPGVTRPVKPSHPPSGPVNSGSSSKSRSAAAADARQTVQEKNAYEYERVMDILRYYRELVVERKLPGACLPCKRRKSKPLVSAHPVTPVTTRPALLRPPSSSSAATQAIAVPTSQYVQPVAMSTWRGSSAGPVLCLMSGCPTTPVSGLTAGVSSSPSRAPVQTNGETSMVTTVNHDDIGSILTSAEDSVPDEMPSRPSSVELGTARSFPVNDDLPDCSRDLTRTCSSAPGLCDDENNGQPSPSTEKIALERRRRPSGRLFGGARHRTLRRSVDLRRFVSRPLTVLERSHGAGKGENASGGGGKEDEPVDVAGDTKAVATLPVKHTITLTTNSVVVKWTKAHLAICGPYQSWT